jgi:PAS domain S-box-containing protein
MSVFAIFADRLKSPLARRLIVAIVLFSATITLAITAIQIYQEYRREIAALETQFRQIQDVHLRSLAQSLWATNNREVQTQLEGMINMPNISYVAVYEDDVLTAKAGTPQPARSIERRYVLFYDSLGQHRLVGTLVVVATLEEIYRYLWDDGVSLLLSNALSTFLVAIFISVLFHRLVTRHLADIAGHLTRMQPHLPQVQLVLARFEPKKTDELDILVAAVNTLQDKIRTALSALSDSESRLSGILDIAGSAIISIDEQQRIFQFNHQAEYVFGWRAEEMLGQPLDRLLPDRYRVLHYTHVALFADEAATTRRAMERGPVMGMRKGGEEFPLEASISKLVRNGRSIYTVALEDVSVRRAAENEIRALNADLENRVQKRTAELKAAKDEAERASLAKSEFLSSMSHELRTPLNAILGFSQLLEHDALSVDQRESVHQILRAGWHLLELINELLDLARIEAGKLTVSNEIVPLAPLLHECQMLIQPLAETRGIRIVESGKDCIDSVQADRTRLKQVLLNLFSNAVKYNREQGTVGIVCKKMDTVIQIRITDTGAGLSDEQQARLFAPFERLGADKSVTEGTGIGLALSRRLMDLMHGRIGVDSKPGLGSTFWIELPAAGVHQGDTPLHSAGVAATSPAVHPVFTGIMRTVLCIEDNPANLRLIERILEPRQGLRLLSASQPNLGLELAQAHLPDLILLDINLPDMDGYAVMECLRTNAATRHIPVVAISANAMPKDLARGKAAGFADYLTKPLDVNRLLQAVENLLHRLADGDDQS